MNRRSSRNCVCKFGGGGVLVAPNPPLSKAPLCFSERRTSKSAIWPFAMIVASQAHNSYETFHTPSYGPSPPPPPLGVGRRKVIGNQSSTTILNLHMLRRTSHCLFVYPVSRLTNFLYVSSAEGAAHGGSKPNPTHWMPL